MARAPHPTFEDRAPLHASEERRGEEQLVALLGARAGAEGRGCPAVVQGRLLDRVAEVGALEEGSEGGAAALVVEVADRRDSRMPIGQ